MTPEEEAKNAQDNKDQGQNMPPEIPAPADNPQANPPPVEEPKSYQAPDPAAKAEENTMPTTEGSIVPEKTAPKPWVVLGITEELYKEIAGNITKQIVPEIKKQVQAEMQQMTETAEKRVNGKEITYADKLLEKFPRFKVKLGKAAGQWQSHDGSIVLSIFPNNKQEVHTLSQIIDVKHPDIEQIKLGINVEEIVMTSPDEKQENITYRQLSKGENHTGNLRMGNVPEEIKTLLNNTVADIISKLQTVTSLRILQILLNLERQAQSTANKTRPNVISAIHDRIKALPLKTVGMGAMVDSNVTEEMPPEDKKKAEL